MHPRTIRDTFSPDRPRLVYSINARAAPCSIFIYVSKLVTTLGIMLVTCRSSAIICKHYVIVTSDICDKYLRAYIAQSP